MKDDTVGKGDAAFIARVVREEALKTEILEDLQLLLPDYEAAARPTPQGLFIDARPSPPVRLKDEVRVSIARVVAVTPMGHRLLGQVQASARESKGETNWSFKFFVHSPEGFMTRELATNETWWVAILEAYYSIGGPTIDTKIEVIV